MFQEERPTEMWEIKLNRKRAAERSRQNEKHLSNYSDLELLQKKEEQIQTKAKQLKRDL